MTDEDSTGRAPGAEPDERHIVGEVFDAGRRQIREVLLRTEVEFLAAAMPLVFRAAVARSTPVFPVPVYQESYDDVIGFISVTPARPPTRRRYRSPVEISPAGEIPADQQDGAVSVQGDGTRYLAIVVDEYGGTAEAS